MKNFSKDSAKKFNVKNNKRKSSFIKADMFISKDTPDSIVKEIIEVLSNANFDKLSCPLYTYKYMLKDDSASEGDDRTATIGFIRSFNAEKAQFNVTIFNNQIDIVSSWNSPMVEVVFTTKKDKETGEESLGIITKLNIVRTENSSSEYMTIDDVVDDSDDDSNEEEV